MKHKPWGVYEYPDGGVEERPIDDLYEHETWINCLCNPQVDEDGVLVHNSFDGREVWEDMALTPKKDAGADTR